MHQELFPFCFSSHKSINFELLALLPFRKYIVFSTLQDIKKIAHLYIGCLKYDIEFG